MRLVWLLRVRLALENVFFLVSQLHVTLCGAIGQVWPHWEENVQLNESVSLHI